MTAPTVPLLTVEEAAALARVHHNTLRKLLNAGQIAGAFRVGRQWRVPADFCARFPVEPAHAAAG